MYFLVYCFRIFCLVNFCFYVYLSVYTYLSIYLSIHLPTYLSFLLYCLLQVFFISAYGFKVLSLSFSFSLMTLRFFCKAGLLTWNLLFFAYLEMSWFHLCFQRIALLGIEFLVTFVCFLVHVTLSSDPHHFSHIAGLLHMMIHFSLVDFNSFSVCFCFLKFDYNV